VPALNELDAYDWDGVRNQIVDLAGRGFTATYIAKKIGRSPAFVSKILKSEFKERNSNRQQIIEAHFQTVQWLKMKLTERITVTGAGFSAKDAELLLKVLDREARLFGLDKPQEHNVNVSYEDLSNEELIEQLRQQNIPIPAGFTFKELPPAVEDAIFEVSDAPAAEDDRPAETGPSADLSGA